MNKYFYTIKWTQPYRLDYSTHYVYNQHEQLIEQMLSVSPMLEAIELISRIKQL